MTLGVTRAPPGLFTSPFRTDRQSEGDPTCARQPPIRHGDDPENRFRFVADHHSAHRAKRLCESSRCPDLAIAPACPPGCRTGCTDGLDRHPVPADLRGQSLHAKLRSLDERCLLKRVERLMAASNPIGVHARRRWRASADMTQFRTKEGRLYLARVVELYSKRVFGWATSASAMTDLVIDAFVRAFRTARPIWASHSPSVRQVTDTTVRMMKASGPRSRGERSWIYDRRSWPTGVCFARGSSTTSRASTSPADPQVTRLICLRSSTRENQWLRELDH